MALTPPNVFDLEEDEVRDAIPPDFELAFPATFDLPETADSRKGPFTPLRLKSKAPRSLGST